MGVVDEQISDAEVLSRVSQGESAMFRVIVDRHARRLHAWAWRYTSSEDDAEELVQETLLRAFRSANKYDPSRPCIPWLFTILANLCHNWHKTRRPAASLDRETPDGGKLLDTLASTQGGPESSSLDNETVLEVRAAVNHLETGYRTVFLLYYFEDFSLAEIAQTVGIPIGTVKSRLHYGGKKLAQVLARRAPE
jgi:RNA polymerase sigma-70 factor (ECF subfamily)